MSFELVGFSQDVDLSRPKEVNYYLVFTGGMRLPVLKATVDSLIEKVYAGGSEQEVVQDPNPEPEAEEPRTFGGDFSGNEPPPVSDEEESLEVSPEQANAYQRSLQSNPDPDLDVVVPGLDVPRPKPVKRQGHFVPPNPAAAISPGRPRRAPLKPIGDDGVESI